MSKITGIVAEYNPFHKGHVYHLEQARAKTGADYLVVVMSGDFVQRGTPAIFDKYTRTQMALQGGADLVLELPSRLACASAEPFAAGSVSILDLLGCVDFICFGSESGRTDHLEACADLLLEEPAEYKAKLQLFLKQGLSFPAARKEAVKHLGLSAFPSDLLDSPNNILGLEYMKALKKRRSSIQPCAITRIGAGYHDTCLSGSFTSATAIRTILLEDPENSHVFLREAMPEPAAELAESLLLKEIPVTEDDFSQILQYDLMLHDLESLTEFSDMSQDLARRICRLLPQFQSFSQFAGLLKTRELTYTRIMRTLLHVVLNMKEKEDPLADPGYVRILGLRKESSSLLKEIRETSSIPLLTKAADYKKLLPAGEIRKAEQDFFVSDLYEMIKAGKNNTSWVKDIQRSPIILA